MILLQVAELMKRNKLNQKQLDEFSTIKQNTILPVIKSRLLQEENSSVIRRSFIEKNNRVAY